ncbi:MAG TPA: helix-turn-helix domain-containing protein [Actinomycetes bacterium]|jgi:sugar-specific transcriptional regulator TrmB|nr:helix-turn-helix domain-containing protein [Actinomycetes bacterium]
MVCLLLRLATVVPSGKDRSLTQSGDSDLIDRLVRHGLGQGEARCYVGMLAQRAFKVSEVATEAGLPRSRAYELIRSLVRFGLCTEVAGGGFARFRAVPPNEAIGRLEASKAEQARRRDRALNGLVQALAMRAGPTPGSGEEPVEMLRRREQLLSIMATEVCQATREVLTIVNTSWEPTDCRGLRDRLAAGVRFRIIFDRDSLEHEPHLEWVAAFAGEPRFEARVVDRVETLYLLVDGSVVLLNLTVPGSQTPGSHAESLLIRHEGLGQVLGDAFERTWAQGVPFDQALEDGEAALVGATTSARGPAPGSRASNGRSPARD